MVFVEVAKWGGWMVVGKLIQRPRAFYHPFEYAQLSSSFLHSCLQFFNVIVLPLFSSLAAVLPDVEPMLEQVKANHSMWLCDMAARFIFAKPSSVPEVRSAKAVP